MRILVIEDSPWNIESAKLTLKDHELTIATNILEGYECLDWWVDPQSKKRMAPSFDAVLTDLFLPPGNFQYSEYAAITRKIPPESMPAGLVFALRAMNLGIRTLIVTSVNHHDDWLCNVLDILGRRGWETTNEGRKPKDEVGQRLVSLVYETMLDSNWADGHIVKCDWREKHSPSMKDWLESMKRSALFPELGPPTP